MANGKNIFQFAGASNIWWQGDVMAAPRPRRGPIMHSIALIALNIWARVTAGPRRCHNMHGIDLIAIIALIFGKIFGGREPAGPRRCSHSSRGSNIWC
jgi:hypothetical protein